MLSENQLVLLISPKGKRYIHKLSEKTEIQTHDGVILVSSIEEAGFGGYAHTHLGKAYLVLCPTVHDLINNIRRQTQIMYPKEIGYLLLKMGIGPGSRVVESGTGSGGLTTALAWYVGDTGKVYTYERREEFYNLAKKNLKNVGLEHRVVQTHKSIEFGFDHTDCDALFLDVRTPWEYLHHIPKALKIGAMCGFLLPTCNQVSDLLRALEDGPFDDFEVTEILIRHYKTVPDRLRPEDRMIAHTGFLVFARYMVNKIARVDKKNRYEREASASYNERSQNDGLQSDIVQDNNSHDTNTYNERSQNDGSCELNSCSDNSHENNSCESIPCTDGSCSDNSCAVAPVSYTSADGENHAATCETATCETAPREINTSETNTCETGTCPLSKSNEPEK